MNQTTNQPRQRGTLCLFTLEGDSVQVHDLKAIEFRPGDPINFDLLIKTARNVIAMQDQHGGPYPQYPELHKAIEELREGVKNKRC